MSVLQIVKGCPLFYELYDEEILRIVESCRVVQAQKGDFVFNKGDLGNEIFLILNGSAKVIKNGTELAKLRRGDLFGEMVLLKDNIRNADIQIQDFSDILVIDYNTIFNLYESNIKVFSVLMLNLARMLATRLKKAGDVIELLKTEEKDKNCA